LKIFNEGKLSRLRALEPLLKLLAVPRLFLLPLAFILRLRPNRPRFLIADGFLIGDCVLLRPLAAAAARSGSTLYFAGAHAKPTLQDLPVRVMEGQWPWASYDYSFGSLLRLLSFLLRVFLLQPRCIIEPRGDVRSLSLLYLCCPGVLAGYDFTGGRFMLNVRPDAPEIVHLEEHNRRLAAALDLDYRLADIAVRQGSTAIAGHLAVSLSGSQPLKSLPLEKAHILFEAIRGSQKDMRIVYLVSPQDFFLAQTGAEALLQKFNVTLWRGSFADYTAQIESSGAYIGMDSAGGHIAAMYGVPSLLFFGTMKAEYCAPVGPGTRLVLETTLEMQCRPCAGVVCTNQVRLFCLESIENARIQNAAASLLSEMRIPPQNRI
jgi:ADP-heptose:LPS heptosyltransferase